jgi:hypothetical protein
LDLTPKAQTKASKWDYIKLNVFCIAKDIINAVRRQVRMEENI